MSQAAVVTNYNEPLEMRDIPLPKLGEGAMIARVDAATLCATDVKIWHGAIDYGPILPYIPGHETAAIVEEINGERTDILGEPLKPGDRVLVAYRFCGHCFHCTIGQQPNLCPAATRYGRVRVDQHPYLLGGCAQHHYYPEGADVIRVPDEVSSPLAASAACAFRTVMHGFEKLGGIGSAEDVVVQGSGPLGLFATAVARDRGARRVFTIGAPAARLKVAKDMGADEVCSIEEFDRQARKEWIMDMTSGRGPDVVIQCVGAEAVAEGLDLVRRGGRFLSIGAGSGDQTIPGAIFTNKNLTVVGILSGMAHHFYQALDFLATRKNTFPFDNFITGTYRLDQTTEALEAMAAYREVKPVILPNA